METYERDPKHPDAHPIISSGESKRIVYDHNLLSEGQKRWEAKRVLRRQIMRQKRLEREAEERAEREKYGGPQKEHLLYIDPYPAITPHDFDGPIEKCTECNTYLWGTKYVYPLWKKCDSPHPLLTAPYCEGCLRLYSPERRREPMDLKEKLEVIRWLLLGEHDDITEDYNPLDYINFNKRRKQMSERAGKMRSIPLFDHPSWDCLKSIKELEFEAQVEGGPNARAHDIFKKYPGIKQVNRKEIPDTEIPDADQLRNLVLTSGGEDALLGHRCSPYPDSEVSISFDHIEPVSKVRYRPGSYSIGNLQILSKCLNRVKGNYPNREVVRWLSQLIDNYQEKYSQ